MKTARLRTEAEFSAQKVILKLLHDSPRARVVLFCLNEGQEVPPHTSPSEVIFYTVSGKGTIQVSKETEAVEAGCLVACPPRRVHAIRASERMQVLAIITPRPE